MGEELKACPFCGGEARLISGGETWNEVVCDCGVMLEPESSTKHAAIAVWNRRASGWVMAGPGNSFFEASLGPTAAQLYEDHGKRIVVPAGSFMTSASARLVGYFPLPSPPEGGEHG